MKNLLITGGAGFIGANFVHYLLSHHDYRVVVFDKLTYAGNLNSLKDITNDRRYAFVHGDICDAEMVEQTIRQHDIDTIVNFAAETHVDRSILDPDAFIQTDVYGTYVLLEAVRKFGLQRYHQVSTDEVYGHIPAGHRSRESDQVAPRSPYAASKTGGDLLVRAYYTTYNLPVTISRGSNNVGPYQYPEKVVPLFTTNALDDQPLPVYGDGRQMRDYQYVLDHCEAIDLILHKGEIGEIYNIGTGTEIENLEMVQIILDTLKKSPNLIKHVTDRPGHDRRYALDIAKIKSLGWQPRHTPQEAIRLTVQWYLENEWWWRPVKEGDFQEYYQQQYGERLATEP